jgi:thiamine-phosphate pyrophosphorylase
LLTREDDSDQRLFAGVSAALGAGARCVQYRDKSNDPQRRQRQARALLALCQQHQVPLIINDDVALALRIGADGVHLGKNDPSVAVARARLGPQALIGVSCYDQWERAQAATAAGADYLAFGAFFDSDTKPQAIRAAPELLRRAACFGLPRVAIGGINADNGATLIRAGADALAVLGAIWTAADPAAAARAIAELFVAQTPQVQRDPPRSASPVWPGVR